MRMRNAEERSSMRRGDRTGRAAMSARPRSGPDIDGLRLRYPRRIEDLSSAFRIRIDPDQHDLAFDGRPRFELCDLHDMDQFVELFDDLLHFGTVDDDRHCLLYTSPSPRDRTRSR